MPLFPKLKLDIWPRAQHPSLQLLLFEPMMQQLLQRQLVPFLFKQPASLQVMRQHRTKVFVVEQELLLQKEMQHAAI